MTKEDFKKLLIKSLEISCDNAEKILGFQISRRFKILLHGAGYSGLLMTLDEATEVLYLESDTFYRIIDLSVIEVSKNYTTIFVRASSHEPSSFDSTWNTPKGFGPFKQLIPVEIKLVENNQV